MILLSWWFPFFILFWFPDTLFCLYLYRPINVKQITTNKATTAPPINPAAGGPLSDNKLPLYIVYYNLQGMVNDFMFFFKHIPVLTWDRVYWEVYRFCTRKPIFWDSDIWALNFNRAIYKKLSAICCIAIVKLAVFVVLKAVFNTSFFTFQSYLICWRIRVFWSAKVCLFKL